MNQPINRRALAEEIHANAVAKGFWGEEYSPEHYLMLAIMDLSGAVEAHQVSHRADYEAHKRALNDPTSKEGVIARSMGEDLINEIAFEEHIAYTLEDKLADAYIRLLDLAGGFDWEVSSHYTEYEESAIGIKGKTFTESVYHAIDFLIAKAIYQNVCTALSIIEAIAKAHDIDLAWHIEEKMKYNETRPNKHGKEY